MIFIFVTHKLRFWVLLEVVDRAGNSSLLSLVKTFDSVLDVYEGFCNLKQVKNKILCLLLSFFRKQTNKNVEFFLFIGGSKAEAMSWFLCSKDYS